MFDGILQANSREQDNQTNNQEDNISMPDEILAISSFDFAIDEKSEQMALNSQSNGLSESVSSFVDENIMMKEEKIIDEFIPLTVIEQTTMADKLVKVLNAANPPPIEDGAPFVFMAEAKTKNDLRLGLGSEFAMDTSMQCNITLRFNRDNLQIIDTTTDQQLLIKSIDEISEIIIQGIDYQDDTLTVDFNGSDKEIPITFHGGAAGFDTLIIENGSFNNSSYIATGQDAGTITLDDTVIYFTGLEPIKDNGADDNRIFEDTTTGNQQIRIVNDSTEGYITIDSNGTGGFESITFPNPTVSLTVNAGIGDDIIIIESLDESFSAAIYINGQDGSDTLQIMNSNYQYLITGNNSGQVNDPIDITFNLTFTGIESLKGGTGDDIFKLDGGSVGYINGGDGYDTLLYSNDDSYISLSDGALSTSGGMNISLASIENAELQGGQGENNFDISGWTGSGSLDGQHDIDSVTVNDDADMDLSASSINLSSGAWMTLDSIENAYYTGGESANIINIDSFKGSELSTIVGLSSQGGDDDILVVIPETGPDATYTINGGDHDLVGDRLVLDAQLQPIIYDLDTQTLDIGSNNGKAIINYENIEILEILNPDVEILSDSLLQIEQALNDLKTWAASLQTNDELYDVIPFIDRSLANIIEPAAVIYQFADDVIFEITEKLEAKYDPENNPFPTLTSKEFVDIINNWSATFSIVPDVNDPYSNDLSVDLGDITVSISQLATIKLRLLPDGPELLFDFTIGSERTSLFDLARSQVLLDHCINLDPENTGDEMGDVTAQLRSGMEFGLELGIDNFNGSAPGYFSNQYNMVFSGHLIGQITGETSVDVLNNGHGLDITGNGPHMRILRTNGDAVDVDLSGVDNVQDILDKFNDLVSISGSGDFATINSNSTGITLSDNNGKEVLKVEALNGSQVAAQLGLLGDDYSDGTGDNTIEGKAIGLLVPITDGDSNPNTLDADIGFAGGQVTGGEVALSFTTEMAFSDPSSGDKGVDEEDMEQGFLSGLSQSGNLYMILPVAISGSDFAGSGNADITGIINVGDNQSNFFATHQEVVFSSQELQNFTHVTANEAFMLLAQVAGAMQQIDNSDFFHVAIPFVQFGLTSDTPLAALNKATGVGTVSGNDLKITLSNGTESELDIDS